MKRSRERLLYEVLKICQKPTNTTKIVYKCNLNFKLKNEILRFLLDTNMIETDGNLFQSTPKGLQYMNAYRELILIQVSH
jgi:predicted transcriptional regulator